ncbi:unnamed protein product, partial [Hymenolepis diminuta]
MNDFRSVVQHSNTSILSRCFYHWLNVIRMEKWCRIFHGRIHTVEDKVEKFLHKFTFAFFNASVRKILPTSSDRRNQNLRMSSSKSTYSANSSGSQSIRRVESVIVKIDNQKNKQADSIPSSHRSNGSGKVIADLQRMRENRLKHLQVRNERRERIRIENL